MKDGFSASANGPPPSYYEGLKETAELNREKGYRFLVVYGSSACGVSRKTDETQAVRDLDFFLESGGDGAILAILDLARPFDEQVRDPDITPEKLRLWPILHIPSCGQALENIRKVRSATFKVVPPEPSASS